MPEWQQLPLIAQPIPLVSVELTIHYDGPAGTITSGYRVFDTTTRETIAMRVSGLSFPIDQWHVELPNRAREVHRLVMPLLGPF